MSRLIDNDHFKLNNGLVINLSLNWKTQKQVLGKMIVNTGSSFGRGFPQILVHGTYWHPETFDLICKSDDHYYHVTYEKNLSKVRSIEVYNEFSNMIMLYQRHGFWSFL